MLAIYEHMILVSDRVDNLFNSNFSNKYCHLIAYSITILN